MEESGYNSKRISEDKRENIDFITMFTISNDGETDLDLDISGVRRTVKPGALFEMEPDGTYTAYEIEFKFEGGAGSAILDYKRLKNNC